MAVTSMMAAYTVGTICQPAAAMMPGATSLVSDEPALPAPNTPIAMPC